MSEVEDHEYARDQAEQRLRRVSWYDQALRLAVAAIVVLALASAAVTLYVAAQNSDSRRRADCVARIQGKVLGFAFEALAPGTPDARKLAVGNGRAEAHKLSHPDQFCP